MLCASIEHIMDNDFSPKINLASRKDEKIQIETEQKKKYLLMQPILLQTKKHPYLGVFWLTINDKSIR